MSSRLIVRRLDCDEEPAGLSEWTTAAEQSEAVGFAPRRRREYLMWRAVVRQELGRDVAISYAANGAPQVDCGAFISISHSADLVTVCISDGPCAVDTEPLRRNFDRVKPRYLSAAEASLSDDVRLAAAVWCAKEALYKLASREGIDFLNDIRIVAVDFTAGTITGTVCGGSHIVLKMEFVDDNIIVYC